MAFQVVSGDPPSVHGPDEILVEQGPEALLDATAALLEAPETTLALLLVLQGEGVPARWHRRITRAVIQAFFARTEPDPWLADWLAEASRHEPLHPDERATLLYRAVVHDPCDDDTLVAYLACQLDAEHLHDADWSSVEPAARSALELLSALLTHHIGGYAPALSAARERWNELPPEARARLEALLTRAGCAEPLAGLAASST